MITASIWTPLVAILSTIIQGVLSHIAPASLASADTTPVSAISPTVFSQMIGFMQLLGTFINLRVLFGCIAFILLWRGAWALVTFWRWILKIIPMAG